MKCGPWMTALLLAAGLSGCDNQAIGELEEGVATEADVVARLGQPENVWDGPEGRVLEFNRQPAGHKNYMITIGADGKMSALRQVLTPENFARVQVGLPMEEVRRMLGKPMRITPFALKREVAYDWRYMAPPNSSMVFSVYFDDRDYRVLRTGSSPDRSIEANAN